MRKQFNKQSGITLIEAGLWIFLMSLAIASMAVWYNHNRDTDMVNAESQYLVKMAELASGYMDQNPTMFEHMQSNNVLTCNASYNVCDINLTNLSLEIKSETNDLSSNTYSEVSDAFCQGNLSTNCTSYARVYRGGVAPNYSFNGIILTNHTINTNNLSTPSMNIIGAVVKKLGINAGYVGTNNFIYGYYGAWTQNLSEFKLTSINGALAYKFGDWSGSAEGSTTVLPIDGSKPMLGNFNLSNFNIYNVNNIIANGSIIGHQSTSGNPSVATINGSVNAVTMQYYESNDGTKLLGINLNNQQVITSTYNINNGDLGNNLSGIGIIPLTSQSSSLFRLNASSFTTNLLTLDHYTDGSYFNLSNFYVLGDSTINQNLYNEYPLFGNINIYGEAVLKANNSGDKLGVNLNGTMQVDGDSTFHGLSVIGNSGNPSSKTVNSENVEMDGSQEVKANNISTSDLETYEIGTLNQNSSNINVNSLVYLNQIKLVAAQGSGLSKYGLNLNINNNEGTTTVYGSGVGVATATCPSGFYAYSGGPDTSLTSSGAGAGCNDPNDWANDVHSKLQASYPVSVNEWAVVCTYPGPNPPQQITAHAYVNCYKPLSN